MNDTKPPTPPAAPTEQKTHKDELRQNDLAEFLTHLGPWCKRHQKDLIWSGLIVLVLVAFFGGRWYTNASAIAAQESAWDAVSGTALPQSLAQIAATYTDMPAVHNRALLNAADQLMREAVFGVEPQAGGLPADVAEVPEESRGMIEQAIGYYQQVVAAPQPADPPLARVDARLGLAAAFTTLGEFDKAREQYQRVQKEAIGLPNHQALAKLRLDELQDPPTLTPLPQAEADAEPEAGAEAPVQSDEGEADADAPADSPADGE